ncbi:hypothetical protein [Enterobacter sp. Bisph1]|uniref:hypothetical protein n=1 Tax=Enterobacter sp. Bisph1 TaxID=1274399 RepID=UPI00068CF4EE|nr:hypothetical protein [Enterobacter sp. Bisph1]
MYNFNQCKEMTKSTSWTFVDFFRWKALPDRFGGGRNYLRTFKDFWVKKNSSLIRSTALYYQLPLELLAGVCWIEVGGDPNIMDRIALNVRIIDWSGSPFLDRHFTVTSPPNKTSFGFVSIQLRTAAKTLGLNAEKMDTNELRALSKCLEKDIYNIKIVGMHLRQLANYDNLPTPLSMDDVRIIGARYNRGTNPSLENIKNDTRYGDFIVRNWDHFTSLING